MEFRPPSPTPAYTEAELLSSVVQRLGKLEEKVSTLQAKPTEMPYEKEELLNAAVCRVDALEAELIATKKVSIWFLCYYTEMLHNSLDVQIVWMYPFNHTNFFFIQSK